MNDTNWKAQAEDYHRSACEWKKRAEDLEAQLNHNYAKSEIESVILERDVTGSALLRAEIRIDELEQQVWKAHVRSEPHTLPGCWFQGGASTPSIFQDACQTCKRVWERWRP